MYNKVIGLHRNGLGCRRISKIINIPIPTIYNWLYRDTRPMKFSEKYKQSRIWLDKERWPEIVRKATENRLKSKKFWEGRKIAIEKISKKLPEDAKRPSRELAYIIGTIWGDGLLEKTYVRLKVKDYDFAQTFADTLLKWSGYTASITKNQEGLCVVRFYSTLACKFLSKIRFSDIKKWNQEERTMFLRGMYDSEGCVAKKGCIIFFNSNIKIINLVSSLLSELNIDHSITSSKPSKGKIGKWEFVREKAYRIFITNYENKNRFYRLIGFSIKRKQDRLKYLEELPQNGFVTDDIISKMFELRKQGLPYRKIASELNLGYGTIIYHIRKTNEGVPPW